MSAALSLGLTITFAWALFYTLFDELPLLQGFMSALLLPPALYCFYGFLEAL